MFIDGLTPNYVEWVGSICSMDGDDFLTPCQDVCVTMPFFGLL